MAADYVRQALRERKHGASVSADDTRPLADTLQELFTIFFPGKKFLGPVPTEEGNLSFPVQVADGSIHDIDELSSGEKEVLFGYLRLRNSAPRYSVILLDEPELHLNPALVRGLPQFYHKHLSVQLNNQIWLVTHSDAFLREAMGTAGLRVFHMQHSAASKAPSNQLQEIQAGEEVEVVILEMVGDLAAYRPGAKIVFFEGDNSEFDVEMVSRLFPVLQGEMNFVSGGSRARVQRLHDVLDRSIQAGDIPVKIYSVVDRDSQSKDDTQRRRYSWDVYHIENYLLEPQYIRSALNTVNIQHVDLSSTEGIGKRLQEIASVQIDKLVMHTMRKEINAELVRMLNLNADPNAEIEQALHQAVRRSAQRISNAADNDLDVAAIEERVEAERKRLQHALDTGEWKREFRGRDILRRFAGDYVPGMRYEHFRNILISQMANATYQPAGMKAVLDKIVRD